MPWDTTHAFAKEGYAFVSNRLAHNDGQAAFETRLLGERTSCMRGAQAAELFYATDHIERAGAAPARVERTLFGQGGVQGLDDDAHRWRKRMFLELMSVSAIDELASMFAKQWQHQLAAWQRADRIVLHEEVARMLCRAVHGWAGVPLAETQVTNRTKNLLAMVEAPAAIGPRYWRGRLARAGAEDGLARLVHQIRAGTRPVPDGSAAQLIANHRDQAGTLLPSRVAAVELLNIIRPTVAVTYFVTGIAMALHDHPEWRLRFADGADELVEPFVHEVRRWHPFFPVVAGRVRSEFSWAGLRFPRGRRVLLDLYGTNRDPQSWADPERFQPERFAGYEPSAYELIPQGGGTHAEGHRCPGEWITVALMKTALRALTRTLNYTVPPQDLRLRLWRIPARPRSGFVLTNVYAAQ